MANVKLSQIASGGTINTSTDTPVAVRSGTTDVLVTLGSLASQSGTFSGTSSGTNTGDQTITLTGDVTGTGTGSFVATLATVNSNTGSFGSSTSIPNFTVNGKGLITAAGGNVVIAPAGTLSGTTLAATVVTSSITTLGSSASLPGNPTTTTQAAGDNSTKIATDAFVTTAINNAIAGVNPAVAVTAATTAAGDTSSWTYANGASGVGATFTGPVNTAITIDGITFNTINTQSLLVKNDTQSPSGAFNGIYTLTAVQTVGTGAIFTRRLDFDMPSDINSTGAIPVTSGTANASTSWVVTSTVVTMGTDPITFTQFSLNPTTIFTTAGAGLTGSTNTVSLDLTHVNGWTAQQYAAASVLTFGSTIAWNLNTAQAASITGTSNINFTLSNPTNLVAGGTYTLIITQYSTGGQVITWSSAYKFPGGTKFVLSTGNNAVDVITFISDGTNMFAVGQAAFS